MKRGASFIQLDSHSTASALTHRGAQSSQQRFDIARRQISWDWVGKDPLQGRPLLPVHPMMISISGITPTSDQGRRPGEQARAILDAVAAPAVFAPTQVMLPFELYGPESI